jgi:hypothetical protein
MQSFFIITFISFISLRCSLMIRRFAAQDLQDRDGSATAFDVAVATAEHIS